MNTKEQIRDIFECNIPVCNSIPRSEQFKIWEDGFRVGYINGTDDAKGSRECVESAARNADIQDAYESGYEDGVYATKKALKENKPREVSCLECAYCDTEHSICDHEDGGYLSSPSTSFCQNFKKPKSIGKYNDEFYYCGKCGCGGKNWNLYSYCPICGISKEWIVNE